MLCSETVTNAVAKKFFESPEFFRYQIISANLLDTVLNEQQQGGGGASSSSSGTLLGALLSTGLSTFLHLPTAAQLSLTMSIFFPAGPLASLRSVLTASSARQIGGHQRHDATSTLMAQSLQALVSSLSPTLHLRALRGPLYRPEKAAAEEAYSIERHPKAAYTDLDVALLRAATAHSGGGSGGSGGSGRNTKIAISRVKPPTGVPGVPLLRCDILNMT